MNVMNRAILKRLKANSRMSWQQIGKEVHLTGQAVAARVQHMEDQGLISSYTIRQANVERHLIAMYMEVARFEEFEQFLQADERVEAAYKTTGDACYEVVFVSQTEGDLEPFLNQLLRYGRYRVASVIRCVK
ncbi:Lrp/AsnC family transcriptional regulator [Thiolinea disciformis]|uniref:Lrp/AsnC family transcriptional regulator n=1 Tax=Thiolinea disciformis TaxID=125614 RepID=UPI000523F5F4|nr:Lrp/AsnC family transcriptional regulator [Thiolinea disciformis]